MEELTMEITGVEAVRYGVEDLEAGRRYFSDLGLVERERGATGASFSTLEESKVELRLARDAALPGAVVGGSTIREYVFGVRSKDTLQQIGAELSKDRDVRMDSEGVLHTTDGSGYGIAFQVSRIRPIPIPPTPVNRSGEPPRRVDQPIDYKGPVPIRHIGHVVYFVPNLKEAQDFYVKRLNFRISDIYHDFGVFMRAAAAPEHHTVFLIGVEPFRGAHHVAFEVSDFNEVMRAGLKMQERGWRTEAGPGRHIIGSNYFWYFKSPCGSAIEYYADIDYLTDNWKTREWQFSPEMIACWMVSATPTESKEQYQAAGESFQK
jgi:catechol 2,3-dioxygenase-like lactoylglutathione lyase family enzyme